MGAAWAPLLDTAPVESPTTPSRSPTLTTSPSWRSIRPSTPSSGAVTSRFTLSVSSSTSVSPRLTASPSLFNHEPTTASTSDSPRRGTRISTGIVSAPALCGCGFRRALLRRAVRSVAHAIARFRRAPGAAVRLDRRHVREHLGDDPRLLIMVQIERAFGRARPLDAAVVPQLEAAFVRQVVQVLVHVAPGAHVARFFLEPDEIGQVRVAADHRPQRAVLEWRELLDPCDCDAGRLSAERAALDVDRDLAGTEHEARDLVLASRRAGVVDHRLERARGELIQAG